LTIICKIGIDLKKNGIQILVCPKSTLEKVLHEKLTKMHWYAYNNIALLLNIAKTQIFHFVYTVVLKIFKFSIYFIFHFVFCLLASQPTCQPAVRPGNTSAMAPDFSHKKGNYI